MHYPSHLSKLIELFKKFPGVGQKSAERFAFKMLEWPKEQTQAFARSLLEIDTLIHFCETCGALSEKERCFFCDNPRRIQTQLCVVAYPRDILTLEETHCYHGLYHVLGGFISPMHHRDASQLNISSLKEKINQSSFEEIILALDSTIEGDATTLFLKKELSNSSISFSRLAFGIPLGSSLDYIDGGTLSKALSGRRGF
jgi:recombination protein RecR